jgi:large subunit ribosomal protein L17
MKKNIGNYKLNRDTKSRKALFKSLMQTMILREHIETTHAKAMAVRPLFEKMITKAKSGSIHELRQIQGILQNAELLKKLVQEIAPRFKEIKGGYTKITPVGARRGDNAKIVKLSLTKLSTLKQPNSVGAGSSHSDQSDKIQEDVVVPPKKTLAKPANPKETKVKTVKLAAKRAGRRGDK